MKRYMKYIRPYLYAFILGPILMITEVVGEVLMPALMADTPAARPSSPSMKLTALVSATIHSPKTGIFSSPP